MFLAITFSSFTPDFLIDLATPQGEDSLHQWAPNPDNYRHICMWDLQRNISDTWNLWNEVMNGMPDTIFFEATTKQRKRQIKLGQVNIYEVWCYYHDWDMSFLFVCLFVCGCLNEHFPGLCKILSMPVFCKSWFWLWSFVVEVLIPTFCHNLVVLFRRKKQGDQKRSQLTSNQKASWTLMIIIPAH